MGDKKKTEDLEDVSGGFTGTTAVGNGPTPPASALEDVDGGSEQTKEQLGADDPLEDVDGGFGKHTMDGT